MLVAGMEPASTPYAILDVFRAEVWE
jgi:hypothetical protein